MNIVLESDFVPENVKLALHFRVIGVLVLFKLGLLKVEHSHLS